MLRCWSALVIASITCTRRPYFSPIGLNPQRNGADRLRDKVARTSLRSPSAAPLGACRAAASANMIGTAEQPAARCRAVFICSSRYRQARLFSQRIDLTDRFAGRFRQIAEIEIRGDLVAHIGFGEAELGSLLGD